LFNSQGCHSKLTKVHSAPVPDFKKNQQNGTDPGCISVDVNMDEPICGEIKVEFYCKNVVNKQKLFQFWFNTFFASKAESKSIFDAYFQILVSNN
jgi:C2 domain of PTEN tumour-suppressor protein